MRKFSSYGPIDTEMNYYAPRIELIEKTYSNLVGEDPQRRRFEKMNSLKWKQRTVLLKQYPLLLVVIVVLGCLVFSQFSCKKAGDGDITPQLPTTLQELVNYVSTAQDLLNWMRSNISYGWPGFPDMNTWKYLSPEEVFSLKQGDCTAQSAFEYYILMQHGYDCHLLWLERANFSDHAVCYWQSVTSLYYLEHAFERYKGIHGPFNTVQEIGEHMYAHQLENDGLTDTYTLYHYDDVPYGVDWFEFHRLLTPIPTVGKTDEK